MNGIPLAQAARALKIHRTTLRRWIAAGCPVVELGEVGRGRGSLVDLAAVRRWKSAQAGGDAVTRDDERVLGLIAESFVDCLKRDGFHHRAQIAEGQAAGFLFLVFERVWMNVTRRSRDEIALPEQMKRLRSIYVGWAEDQSRR
mgnify:FL=1